MQMAAMSHIKQHPKTMVYRIRRAYRDILLAMSVKERIKEIQDLPLRDVAKMEWTHVASRDTVMKKLRFIGQSVLMA
jgi:hypothetical protein